MRVPVGLNPRGQARVESVLPPGWRDRRVITVRAEGDAVSRQGEPWSDVSREVIVETRRPGWARAFDKVGLSYWSPGVLAALILLVLSGFDTRYSRPLPAPDGSHYRQLGARLLGRPENRVPVVTLGGLLVWHIWFGGAAGNLCYVVAKRWLVAGQLTIRPIPSIEAFRRPVDYCGYEQPWAVLRSVASQSLWGVAVKQAGTTETNGFLSGDPPFRPRFDVGRMAS